MKIYSSTAYNSRIVQCLIIFAVVLLFNSNNANAQLNKAAAVKPKAILIADWTTPKENLQNKIISVRPAERENIAGASFKKPVAAATPIRFTGKYSHLKPTALEEAAFALINQERNKQNLPPVEWDLGMLYIARQHSVNMANQDFFSHVGRDGKTADDRAVAAGIKDWQGIGENIAYNQNIKNNVDFAVQSWMRSPKHKENLLNKRWTRSGIGVSLMPDGKLYITQVFRN